MTLSIAIDEKLRIDEPQSTAHAVQLRGVTLVYPGHVTALREVDLTIAPGSHVTVLGASGSGKTSLLACIAGRLAPASGTIDIQGRVATIHQDLRLVKQRTALSNVLDGCAARYPAWRGLAWYPRHERQRAIMLLERVGLSHRLHHRVACLSGGEQQRVAIARALMTDPKILLADEPVASLDNANARVIMRLLSELQRERGITLISVLHDCELAETFADRIVGFESGRLVHDDTACPDNARDPCCTGLRGFRRFQACRACETITAAVQAADHPPAAPIKGRPLIWTASAAAILAVYAASVWAMGVSMDQLDGALGTMGAFLGRLVPTTAAQWGEIPWGQLSLSLLQTMQMALVATTLAVGVSWPLSALAARNVGPGWLRPVVRFMLNATRAVPSIVWALLFVAAVGLGEFAGLLALVFYSIGYLTKFFYESFEAVDPGPPDALREIGLSGPARFYRAVWPASRAAILSSGLFMLEYNVRAASVLGIVGAGGIGYHLKNYVDWRAFHIVGAILLMLIVVVLVLDAISSRVRSWLMKP
jgi:phosphonate ABC transporter permease subunit PhnE